MVDYPIMIDDTEIRVVAIGNKVDLAVNGVYQGSLFLLCFFVTYPSAWLVSAPEAVLQPHIHLDFHKTSNLP